MRSVALAREVALQRIHIESLQAQLAASQLENVNLQEVNNRLQSDRDDWRNKAEQRQTALGHTQVLLECLKAQDETANVSLSRSSPVRTTSFSNAPISPRTISHQQELARLSNHHQSAIAAKDVLIASIISDRDRAESESRRLRSQLAELTRLNAESRYSEAVLAHEQREKFQRMVDFQLEQSRQTADQAIQMAKEARREADALKQK